MRKTQTNDPQSNQPRSNQPDTRRRSFLGSCGGSAAALACATNPLVSVAGEVRSFAPTILIDSNGEPLRPDRVPVRTEFIFQYPYRSTPCFLINLGQALAGGNQLTQANGQAYRWLGGVGPQQSIVAFSAICAHKLSHPSPTVSFIGYREDPIGFLNRATDKIERRAGVIQCCSEHSIYDPSLGAAVVSGPAPQPLAAIRLETTDDMLVATGVYGGAMFDQFFDKFGDRLMLEHGGASYAEPASPKTEVVASTDFTRNTIRCG